LLAFRRVTPAEARGTMESDQKTMLRARLVQDVRTAFGTWFVVVATIGAFAWAASSTATVEFGFPVGNFVLSIAGITFAVVAIRCVRRDARRRLEARAAASLVRSYRARVAASAEAWFERR
jgi:hypothetical protein